MMVNNTKMLRSQKGVTLIETMIGLALSMLVTASMVALMSNSMGSANKIIQMSQLSGELRNAMSMMTRDVRRANYSANAAYCYANSDCGISGGPAEQAGDIQLRDAGGNTVTTNASCFTFGLDRNQDGNAASDNAGGFRRSTNSGVGFVEMWVGNNTPDCTATSANWIPVTDPDFVDVTTFAIDDDRSLTGTLEQEGGTTLTQRIREVNITMTGRLLLDTDITRTVQDSVRVRNDFIN